MKKGFTLIELLISIVILSIMMLFLYKSYASLNKSNSFFQEEVHKVSKEELLKKVIYLDYSLALKSDANSSAVAIINQDRDEDVVIMQTSNSIHNRINPYVAYVVKEDKLYRVESFKKILYPFGADSELVADLLGKVKSFRVYKSKDAKKELYLIHILFEKESEILLKVKALNLS